MTKDPKFKVGEVVKWKRSKMTIERVWNYQGAGWVYDFEKTTHTIIPFHYTGIPEGEIIRGLRSKKPWWKFWA